MYQIEIYNAGNYSYEEVEDFMSAKCRVVELGDAAYAVLLKNNVPDLRTFINDYEYAILGKHQNVWFSSRIKEI